MDKRAALYQQFDPAKALEADSKLYVDWQHELAGELQRDDLKPRLANSISLSGDEHVTRLLTGHRGVGKTTELKRVQRILEGNPAGPALDVGRRYFVSFLEAEEWLDLEDVGAPEIVFQIVRQLVDDLRVAGFEAAPGKFEKFYQGFRELLEKEVELSTLNIPAGPLEFGVVVKQVASARPQLRKLLQEQLPTIYQLINGEILTEARGWLKQEKGCDDILVIVDELDRIPEKPISDSGLTNHVSLFLDYAETLNALDCNVLYTIPIELAYSQRRPRLQAVYGEEILSLPVLPIRRRDGSDFDPGLAALCRIVRARAEQADVEEVCAEPHLTHLCRLSGGHVRNLLMLLRSAIERSPGLPITEQAIDRTARGQADSIRLPLHREHWEVLERVHETKEPVEEPLGLFNSLLRDLYLFVYEDEQGRWYDWNPLLEQVPESNRPRLSR